MKWILRDYMNRARIESFRELASRCGLEYRTLMNHIADAGKFRLYEIEALDEVLKFEDKDLIKILREE